MRIALAQLNPLVGDIEGNSKRIFSACKKAYKQNTDLLITPELSLWGYPPRDLLLNPVLFKQQKKYLNELVKRILQETPQLNLLIGIAEPALDLQLPNLFNSIALINSGGWEVVARKQLLPSYDVFDEKRYFRPAKNTSILKLSIRDKILNIGLTICEDLWVEEEIQAQRIAGPDPLAELVGKEIDLLLNIAASPFSHSKGLIRKQLAAKAAKRLNCPVLYLNQVGGNDELVFDGASFVMNCQGELELGLPICKEYIDIWEAGVSRTSIPIKQETSEEMLFKVLILGLRDYANKCGFKGALIGLSGGIDSALVAVIASAALGKNNISAILMPSPWSSKSSVCDAKGLADRLCIKSKVIPIKPLMESYDLSLTTPLGKAPQGLTAENLQARIRGTLLMAIANEQNRLLLSTGNKSELAVGYCTLYGDMNGGLAVIGDLYKTSVFRMCRWLDSQSSYQCRESLGLPINGELIGKNILEKPPSAELRPNQLDSDSLPKYEILDPILKELIEKRSDLEDLIKKGFENDLIIEIKKLLKKSEFKRRQAPPSLKVSNQAFGSGWRIPIAST